MPTLRRTSTLVLAALAFGAAGPAAAQDVPSTLGKIGTELNDILVGTKLKDVMTGLDGNDKLTGGKGNDQVDGGSGNDKLYGGDGNDVVEGRSGNDLIDGGKGKDKLDGGSGNDRIRSRDGFRDEVFCGSGKDTVTVDAKDLVSKTCEKLKKPKGVKKIDRF